MRSTLTSQLKGWFLLQLLKSHPVYQRNHLPFPFESYQASYPDLRSPQSNATRTTKKMVAQQSFTEQQIGDFQEAFSLFDNKGDGKIFASQLGEVLRALGQNPTESDVKKYQQQYKSDQRISFDIFLPILHEISRVKEAYSFDGFAEGLRHFDTEGNGMIKTSELRHLLTTLGDKLTEEEFKDLVAGQEDSNGNVAYEDFIRNLMSN
ncbi:putative Myosin-2 essential light chain [Hypsibius exemplaris]|uniref:Myosin-2 essential light chain n=1 Tax=Hypsibius exemplaris TaxID=2072580 RepID=A0A9X6NBK9_HYPEX|nr:putative Myosin-2 essential light chain [Hypsibius exemplaris]